MLSQELAALGGSEASKTRKPSCLHLWSLLSGPDGPGVWLQPLHWGGSSLLPCSQACQCLSCPRSLQVWGILRRLSVESTPSLPLGQDRITKLAQHLCSQLDEAGFCKESSDSFWWRNKFTKMDRLPSGENFAKTELEIPECFLGRNVWLLKLQFCYINSN